MLVKPGGFLSYPKPVRYLPVGYAPKVDWNFWNKLAIQSLHKLNLALWCNSCRLSVLLRWTIVYVVMFLKGAFGILLRFFPPEIMVLYEMWLKNTVNRNFLKKIVWQWMIHCHYSPQDDPHFPSCHCFLVPGMELSVALARQTLCCRALSPSLCTSWSSSESLSSRRSSQSQV